RSENDKEGVYAHSNNLSLYQIGQALVVASLIDYLGTFHILQLLRVCSLPLSIQDHFRKIPLQNLKMIM
ncbi:hypothetical protein QIG26_27985, partial [Klebsiella pneumoniae]|nr:hypothetical protein [Klebsiella pneumoniae]